MIKIESKKHINIISKDGNKLGSRKMYEANKLASNVKTGITLYTKSLEELEKYKNEESWCVGAIIDGGIYLITLQWSGEDEPRFNATIDQVLYNMNVSYNMHKHKPDTPKKYVLLRAVCDMITSPKIDF